MQDVRTGNRIGRIQEMTLSPIRPDRPGDLTSERGASTRTTNNGHTRSSRDERLKRINSPLLRGTYRRGLSPPPYTPIYSPLHLARED